MNQQQFEPLDLNEFAEICHNAHIAFCLDKFPSEERALEHFYIEHLNARAAAQAAQPEPMSAPTAEPRKADDVDRLLHQVFLLCEAVEDLPEINPKNEHERGFDRGRRFEAKQIRRAIGDWFQWTFCGQSSKGRAAIKEQT